MDSRLISMKRFNKSLKSSLRSHGFQLSVSSHDVEWCPQSHGCFREAVKRTHARAFGSLDMTPQTRQAKPRAQLALVNVESIIMTRLERCRELCWLSRRILLGFRSTLMILRAWTFCIEGKRSSSEAEQEEYDVGTGSLP